MRTICRSTSVLNKEEPMENTKSHKATIPLSGDVLTRFNAIRDHMTKTMPGISPTSADVLRHTLYLAEKQVSVRAHKPHEQS